MTEAVAETPAEVAEPETEVEMKEETEVVAETEKVAEAVTEPVTEAVAEEKAEPEEPENLRKIFAGGLNRDTADDKFKEYFSKFGEIADCVIIKDNNGTSRGFGFITYQKVSEADKCIAHKKTDEGHKLDNKDIEVKRAIPREFQEPSQHEKSQRIYLGKVREGITEENVKEYFQSNYPCTVETVELIREKKDEAASEGTEAKLRGFAFVSVDDMDAVDKIIIVRNHEINGIPVFAKKAEPKGGSGGRGRGRGGYNSRGGGRGRGGRGGGYGGGYGGYGGGGYGGYGGGGYGGYGGGGYGGAYGGGYGGGAYGRYQPY